MSGTFTTTFTYNGDGHRVVKAENGVVTTYVVAVLGLSQVLVETTGGQATRYVYGHDLLAEYDGEAWAWHLNDGLGSVRQLADSDGNVTLAQGYTPFGVPLWSEGSGATGYGFTGERWEAHAQLLFLRARYYEPGTGRFSGQDPVPGSARNPQSQHIYVYAWNRPNRLTDPSGQQVPPGECLPGEICHSGTTGPYVSKISFPMVQYEVLVPYPDPNSVFGVSYHWEPVQWISPLAELEDKQNLRLCAAPSPAWVLLHFRKSGYIHARQEFFPESVDAELPLAGFVPNAGTGVRRVRIYSANMQLLEEYWEGVASAGVGVGLPKVNVSGGVELATEGGQGLGLAIEAAIAELELQVGETLQATLYFQAPSPVTPRVGYGVDVVLPDNRHLITQEMTARNYGGFQQYGWEKLGPGYWLIDVVRGEQRSDLYNFWHRNYCGLTSCPMYPEELH